MTPLRVAALDNLTTRTRLNVPSSAAATQTTAPARPSWSLPNIAPSQDRTIATAPRNTQVRSQQ